MGQMEEVRKMYNDAIKAQPSLLLGEGMQLDIHKKEDPKVLVIGCTGSGKTHCYVENNITPGEDNYIVSGHGRDLYRRTSHKMKESGYNTVYFCPSDPATTIHFDPLPLFYADEDGNLCENNVKNLAAAIYFGICNQTSKDEYFEHAELQWLEVILYYLLCNYGKLCDIYDLLLEIVQKGIPSEVEELRNFYHSVKKDGSLQTGHATYMRLCAAESNQIYRSAVMNLSIRMTPLRSELCKTITAENDYDFLRMAKEKTVVYIGLNGPDPSLDFLAKLFLFCCFHVFLENSDNMRFTRCILDEFTAFGDIPQIIPNYTAFYRETSHSMEIVVQDLDSCENLYGNNWVQKRLEEADIILSLGAITDYTVQKLVNLCPKQSLAEEDILMMPYENILIIPKDGPAPIWDHKLF